MASSRQDYTISPDKGAFIMPIAFRPSSISTCLSCLRTQDRSLESRVMAKNISGIISHKEGVTFISETFNNTLSSKEIRDRLYTIREKLGTSAFEAAKETAKANNPNMQNYEAKAGDTASQSIADILAKKVLMYSPEYFQQRREACCVSDSESSTHSTVTPHDTASVEEKHESPYSSKDPNSLRRHYGWPLIAQGV